MESQIRPPIDPKTGLYFDNLRCGWTVRADVGKIIRLEVEKLSLQDYDEKLSLCPDFLKVRLANFLNFLISKFISFLTMHRTASFVLIVLLS